MSFVVPYSCSSWLSEQGADRLALPRAGNLSIMTTYRQGGAGEHLAFIIVSSPLGQLLVAGTSRGVCAVKLGSGDEALAAELGDEYPAATIVRDHSAMAEWVSAIMTTWLVASRISTLGQEWRAQRKPFTRQVQGSATGRQAEA